MKLILPKLRKWFPLRFHNRLMLYNTFIFLIVAYMLAFIAVKYGLQLDTIKQLQQSRDTLNAVSNYYDRKHDQFINLIFPLYEQTENYEIFSRLLESKSDQDYETDPYLKMDIVNLMQGIMIRDSDIAGIFIQKKLTGVSYLYNGNSKTLEKIEDENHPFPEMQGKNMGRQIFGTREVKSMSRLHVYAIAGTVGSENIRNDAGKFLVAYRTSEIDRIYKSNADKTHGRFILLTRDGEMIYDSYNQYESLTPAEMSMLMAGHETGELKGTSYYIQTIHNLNRNYMGVNLVPKAELSKTDSKLPIVIYSAVTAMALICAALYSLAGSIISKRVHELIKAMKRIGSNNLSYRVPVNGRNDEFGELATRFNSMCVELEEMNNRKYLSEIRKKNSDLKALQAGINPHFLYNTLEAIRVKANDDGNSEISEMIMLLGNLYRSIVRDDTFIPIRKEISMCDMYMSIFSLRYDSHFEYRMHVSPAILEYGIPKNLLQPIIENYFVHGMRNDDDEPNLFTITGKLDNQDIEFTIEDNGKGISSGRLNEFTEQLGNVEKAGKQAHYGLLNVHERILLVYGQSYGLSLASKEGHFTRVTLRLRALTCEELRSHIAR